MWTSCHPLAAVCSSPAAGKGPEVCAVCKLPQDSRCCLGAGPGLGSAESTAYIPAVVGTLRLDAAALGALVDHLARLQLQALHVLLRGIALGDSALCTQIEFRSGEKKSEQ